MTYTNRLHIDIETFSDVDLSKAGVYAYAASPAFRILLLSYALDDLPTVCVDIEQGEKMPFEIEAMLWDINILKVAHNAVFERICMSEHFGRPIPIEQWQCTMSMSMYLGLPLALQQVSEALKLDINKQKGGRSLITYFCVPSKTKDRQRNLPKHDFDRWELFKTYNKLDVDVEREVDRKLHGVYDEWITPLEKEICLLDQRINDRGVQVDPELIDGCISIDDENTSLLGKEMQDLTGITNSNSLADIKNFLYNELGYAIGSLDKKVFAEKRESLGNTKAGHVLDLRAKLSKTSIAKYRAMRASKTSDNRIRGLLQYYGATRTGRWSGRLVQVQNLPRNKMKGLDSARDIAKMGNLGYLKSIYYNTSGVLSQLTRTAFVPGGGCTYHVADYAAIEARVLAWLAGEQWRLDVFNSHGRIYEASAAQAFKVPIEEVTHESELRSKGKVMELALGYNGGPAALIAMGALEMGLKESELKGIITAWRTASPAICGYWNTIGKAALKAVKQRTKVTVGAVTIGYSYGAMWVLLPSGRRLVYAQPLIEPDPRFNSDRISYVQLDQTTRRWGRTSTYGGKLVENITQAVARDCLAEAMLALEKEGFSIVMHIHDEVICEERIGGGHTLARMIEIMERPLSWTEGLTLRVEGFTSPYYKKD